ncbi:MAG: hexosyltransferase, partial [Synergistetes bacterium]|nr:hexosyltransferase [Synergistota bacterium]
MKIAFVVPWYGEYATGGAESEVRRTVENLNAAGMHTEVLTTCVRGHDYPWDEDFYREGVYEDNGVIVRRFRADRVNKPLFDAVNFKLMNNLPVYDSDEEVFVRESIRSKRLFRYIKTHGDEYVFFFIPYLFGTTYWGSQLVPDRSFIIPCLHDEPYACMKVFKDMFRRVRGLIFHSPAEKRLAQRLYNISEEKAYLVGEGVDTEFESDGERFREKYGLRDPFILYVG